MSVNRKYVLLLHQTININLKLFRMKTKHYATITHNGIELELVGVYTKEEQGTYYYQDGSGTPYSPATFDIEEIKLIDSNINILELFSSDDLEEIESKAVNNLTD